MSRVRHVTDAEFPVTVYGDVDERAVEQLIRCARVGDAVGAAVMADGHVGYSMPIGGVVGYPDHISPSGVGYDISCGVKAVRTHLSADDVPVAAMMDEIFRRVSFGIGRKNNEPVDHPVIDSIRDAAFKPQRALLDMAAAQLGTVGSGNHYVDLLRDEADGSLWVATHFGSRGFGHKTASGFLAMAQGLAFDAKAHEGEMDAEPTLLSVREGLGQAYIEAMNLAGEYAYAGRDIVVGKVLEILGTTSDFEVHNHHNHAWLENHHGRDVWVVRKGATPAFPGQLGFIGGSMGDLCVVVEGVDSPDTVPALASTVHGAGRVMSRTKAAGKWRKRWMCTDRECGRIIETDNPNSTPGKGACPEHPDNTPRRLRVRVGGEIDWDTVRRDLTARGVELRGAGADEAPGVYKDLDTVLAAHEGQIKIRHRLRPIGVAMAGADVHDPFRD